MTAFTFQDQLFSAATGLPDSVWEPVYNSDWTVKGENVTIKNTVSTGYTAYETGGTSGKVIYRYTVTAAGFMCIDLNMPARNSFNVYLNGQHLYSESISLPQMLAVSDVVPGDVVEVRVTCKANENNNMTARAAILNNEVFQKGYDVLNASTLELTSFSNTNVEGTISCNRDGLLYTSIPYDGNWKATVDGKDAPIHLVGGVMVGLQLTEGDHEIVFTYENKAFDLGLTVSLVCLVAFLGLIYWDHREVCNEKIRLILSKIPRKK